MTKAATTASSWPSGSTAATTPSSSPTGELCGLDLPHASPAFVKLSTLPIRQSQRSASVEPCDETTEVLVEAEAAIDQATGLPESVVETNGLAVGLAYDTMGRLLAEVPAEGASRVHKYIGRAVQSRALRRAALPARVITASARSTIG